MRVEMGFNPKRPCVRVVRDRYRKRMMMAYKFRPNPLNNPRRQYDGYQTL